MKETLVKCNQISVDCVKNDPVDVRAGGPDYLGFDFYVAEEKTEEMKKFITETLKKYNIPLSCMWSLKSLDKSSENVWTKERIEECIKKDANYLIKEAKRNY